MFLYLNTSPQGSCRSSHRSQSEPTDGTIRLGDWLALYCNVDECTTGWTDGRTDIRIMYDTGSSIAHCDFYSLALFCEMLPHVCLGALWVNFSNGCWHAFCSLWKSYESISLKKEPKLVELMNKFRLGSTHDIDYNYSILK